MACLTKHSRNVAGTWLFSFQHVLLMCSFSRVTLFANFSQDSRETILIFISCSILHQFNTKLNTIKSHKIQRNKLMQLEHFLSWNKTNIKHSCKSQLYNFFKLRSLIMPFPIWQIMLKSNCHMIHVCLTKCLNNNFIIWPNNYHYHLLLRVPIVETWKV